MRKIFALSIKLLQAIRAEYSFAPEHDPNLERRLFRLISLTISLLVFIVLIPANVFQNISPLVNLPLAILGGASFALYRASVRGSHNNNTLLVMLLLCVNSSWFLNGGNDGSVPFFFLPICMYPLIVFRDWKRWLTVAGIIANCCLLIVLSYRFPWLVTPYNSSFDRIADLIVGITISSLSIILVLWVVLRTYLREQERLKVLNLKLEQEIAERMSAEARLNDQLHFLQQLLDSIPIPVYYKDTDGLYLGCNAAFDTFIGLPRRDIIGKTLYELVPKERADKHYEADLALLCHPGVQIYELSGICRDGEYHDVIFNKATFVNANGCVAGTVGALMDITSLRKAEDERKHLQSQLHQAQKMEAIGQLAGGIAHDFNNILTAIIGYAEIILVQMEKDSKLRHFVEQVLASADRASELTNGLLAFSRRQVLHAKPTDLCGVVRGVEKMLGRLLPEDIDFRTTFADAHLIVIADKGQIEQVLMNLVTNARDAMPRGGTLTVEVSPVFMDEKFVHAHGFGEPGNYACVTVTDTGHGMDEETRKRIFEPFFTTKEVGKGTGLGMAIVYGIIDQHNGRITVSSGTEKGTTFRIYLPLVAKDLRETLGNEEVEQPPGGTETVLFAEDEARVRELHKMILEGAGYRVVEAVDGRDALDKFMERQTDVDILVTDVIMPKIDGKSLYEEIRKTRPDMKVLFMSGYTKDIFMERGILEDEFSYVSKPVKPFGLLRLMREILDRNRLQ